MIEGIDRNDRKDRMMNIIISSREFFDIFNRENGRALPYWNVVIKNELSPAGRVQMYINDEFVNSFIPGWKVPKEGRICFTVDNIEEIASELLTDSSLFLKIEVNGERGEVSAFNLNEHINDIIGYNITDYNVLQQLAGIYETRAEAARSNAEEAFKGEYCIHHRQSYPYMIKGVPLMCGNGMYLHVALDGAARWRGGYENFNDARKRAELSVLNSIKGRALDALGLFDKFSEIDISYDYDEGEGR